MPSLPQPPEPTLDDPSAIGGALQDPGRAGDGAVSLLALTGWQESLRLSDPEVLGLVAMAEQDAAGLAAGAAPATLADLHAGIAPLLPELTIEGLLGAYADAYAAAPGSPMAQVMNGVAFRPETAVSRIQLWALLVDGFVAPRLETAVVLTAALTPTVVPPRSRPATPGLTLPQVPSPIAGLNTSEFAILMAHLLPMAYAIPFDVTPSGASVHEGHGGPGPTIDLQARHQPFYAPPPSPTGGFPLLLPSTGNLSGVPVTWTSANRSILDDHGTLPPTFGTPVTTDASGASHLSYQAKKEEGDQSGPVESGTATITASVPLLRLMLAHYTMPQAVWALLSGDRQSLPVIVSIEWHEVPSWYIDQLSGGGRITGQKCGGLGGSWIADGTYSYAGADGTQNWIIEIDEQSRTGTYTYTDDQVMEAVGGITVKTEGKARGVATITVDSSNVVHMHLRETEHTFRATTSVGGKGQDQNAPLASFDLEWKPGGTC